MSRLQLSHVSKAYGGRPVLVDLDLSVAHGSITALLGPSGSGKTTLLRLVAGFDRVDGGEITIGDVTVDGAGQMVPPDRRHLGYVPQEGALFPHLTVARNVGFGLPRAQRRGARVRELLDLVGLAGLDRRYPDELSGGQRQRVALARALAVEPALVLLDEPFSALDPTLRASIRADVRGILRAANATAVLVTHDQDEALSLADEVAVLRDGRVVQQAAPHELYLHPADAEVARFLGEANVFDTVLADGVAMTPLGPVDVEPAGTAALASGPVTVMIRPEQVRVVQRTVGTGGPRGTVSAAEFHGHDTMLQIQLTGPGQGSQVVARHEDPHPIAIGTAVDLAVEGAVVAWPAAGSPAASDA